jgi:hypothetical protein
MGIFVVWSALAVSLLYALGSSLFLPLYMVALLALMIVATGLIGTYLIMRFPPESKPVSG